MNDLLRPAETSSDKYIKRLEEQDRHIFILEQEISRLETDNHFLKNNYEKKCRDVEILTNSTCWRITAPLRALGDLLKKAKLYINRRNLAKGIKYIRKNGLKGFIRKVRYTTASGAKYEGIRNRFLFSAEQLEAQRKACFSRDITVSIIVPLYNTPEKYLKDMVESVKAQTYGKWELCLADGSDESHRYVGSISEAYAAEDQRIKYRRLEKNFGISGNTNECLQMSTGEYIALLDHDDLLHPSALHEVMKAICEGNADFIYTDESTFSETPEDAYLPHFKPDYAPDNLLANNYICHFTVFSKKILDAVGGFRSEYDGSQDHDFVLRATAAAECIAHIPEVLYFWRAHPGSVASGIDAKSYAAAAGQRAVKDYITRLDRKGSVSSMDFCPSIYRISYELERHPKISIIIPNYEHINELKRCVNSIYSKTTYKNFEILIVENNSCSKGIFDYYEYVHRVHDNLKVIVWKGPFNLSAICNFGAGASSGEFFLFLNNDTEVISNNWLDEMLMYAQRSDVGAVGAKLYYPDGTIQHAGVLLGSGGIANNYYLYERKTSPGYMGRLFYAQNMTAVTGACLMISRNVFDKVAGFNEKYSVAFNDVDLCMKLRRNGYLNVWTPYAELYHDGSKNRGAKDMIEKETFKQESRLFYRYWSEELMYGDSYYNPNFELFPANFQYKSVLLPQPARYTRKRPSQNSYRIYKLED